MRTLIAIPQFQSISGSQIVALEAGEHFIALGHTCDIAAYYTHSPMRGFALRAGIGIIDQPETVNVLDYDLLLTVGGHHMAAAMRWTRSPRMRERTLVACLHTAISGQLAGPGLIWEPTYAEVILTNSPETAEFLRSRGLDASMLPMYNAAPAIWWRRLKPRPLRTIALVSNHAPDEAVAALRILKRWGFDAQRWGEGAVVRRLGPTQLGRADVVITIGKTVQYAIAMGIVPYVYDWFGGPGYLTADNYKTAQWHNFSGRCCRRKISARQMADEIVDRIDAAQSFIGALPNEELYLYRLEPYLERLVAAIPNARANAHRLADMTKRTAPLANERGVILSLYGSYRGRKIKQRQLERYRKAHPPVV